MRVSTDEYLPKTVLFAFRRTHVYLAVVLSAQFTRSIHLLNSRLEYALFWEPKKLAEKALWGFSPRLLSVNQLKTRGYHCFDCASTAAILTKSENFYVNNSPLTIRANPGTRSSLQTEPFPNILPYRLPIFNEAL